MATALQKSEPRTGEIVRPERTYPTTYVPRFDIWEGEEELLLFGDLPGVTPENLDIRFENGALTIHGKVPPRAEGVQFVDGEYGIGDFHRSFTIGEMIDAEKISAEMHNGALTLRLPKSEKARPRRITVKGE